jgi:hypothetical protein
MPKISKYGFRSNTQDIAKYFELDVQYSTPYFFIEIPKEFMEAFKLFSKEQLADCNGSLYLKKGHYGDGNRSGKVSAPTEQEAKANLDKAFLLLQQSSIIKTDVIMITFEKDLHTGHYPSSQYNDDHQRIGMKLGLKYCTKVQLGDKVVYNSYRTQKCGDRDEIVRTEISTDSEDVIIPDTPANRIFLENMYSKFHQLIISIGDHLSTPEDVLNLIESNQKLLS